MRISILSFIVALVLIGSEAMALEPRFRTARACSLTADELMSATAGSRRSFLDALTQSAGYSSATTVLQRGKASTDRTANHGIVAYMLENLLTDEKLYNSALSFYRELKDLDSRTITISPLKGAPIQNHAATELFEIAMRAADSDPYLALKTLAVYGHDMAPFNSLVPQKYTGAVPCKIAELERLRPQKNSNLYLNGALPSIVYDSRKVARARAIAANCESNGLTRAEHDLCNDKLEHYQADYYHVIAAAFLGCYDWREARKSKLPSPLLLPTIGELVADGSDAIAYREAITRYKLNRFIEEIERHSKEISPALRRTLKLAITQLRLGQRGVSEVLRPVLASLLDAHDFTAAMAIIPRYEFELELRQWQHLKGRSLGRKLCH